ncbi:MAG: hypothetical protein M1818_004426 [Claussenomyces sp. TS43310]|nr:MAG: hypothetical protein M1818_004426 [Claussenomyces sp. TS43310]
MARNTAFLSVRHIGIEESNQGPSRLATNAGNRSKYEEMQREIDTLRSQLATESAKNKAISSNLQQVSNGDSVYASPGSNATLSMQRLEDIALSGDRLASLYNQFFTFFHPFLPLLDPHMTADHYFSLSPLLGWTIVLIASRRSPHEPTLMGTLSTAYNKLLWASISEMPQAYHVVKALCLICMWPLPINSSSIDPTFMISGIMMQIALQTGLHRPSHAQDFGKYVKEVNESEIRDRALTWAACNIIFQNASNGYGQPSMSIYDWTLGLGLVTSNTFDLPNELENQLKIAKFSQKVTKTLYSNSSDPIGLISEKEQSTVMSILRSEYQELEMSLAGSNSPINKIYLLAALHHLHCFAFFIPRISPIQHSELSHLYHAATAFIQACLDHDLQSSSLLLHCPNYLHQCFVSAGCTLLKLLNSSFATHLDLVQGKSLFNSTVLALRTISVKNNDLPARLAEALARMWRAAGSGLALARIGIANEEQDDPLQLKIRCRMSVSHVYDCIWGWRGSIMPNQQAPIKKSSSQQQATFSPSTGSLGYAMASQQSSMQSLPLQQQGAAFDNYNLTSTLQDFDLFNSLDWTFDDTSAPYVWPS